MPSAPSLRELAASVLMVGFEGAQPSAVVCEQMRALRPGGVILFARNVDGPPERVAKLVDAITTAINADSPPLVALDQEGGRVARLRDGATPVPAMMALAATGDLKLAERVGYVLGYDVARAAANVNFAPVLDLALAPANTSIGARAFSDDPASAAAFGMAVARGIARAGVVPTYKHFPGHGNAETDPHLALPAIDASPDVFRARDLAPFKTALAGAQAVMCAHIVVRSIDAQQPATLSRAMLTGILREELHFEGVCFTDCLEMGAITTGVGTARAAALALAAGADCPLVSHTYDLALAAVEHIVAAVEDGSLPLARLEQAAGRLQALRAGLKQRHLPVAPADDAAREAARRSITLLRGDPRLQRGGCVLISFDGSSVEGVEGAVEAHTYLRDALTAREIAVRSVTFPLDAQPGDVPDFPRVEDARATRAVVVVRRAHLHPGQPAIVARILAQRPDAIVVSAREPFDVALFDGSATLVCTYSDDAVSMEALADVLVGAVTPQGRLPIGRAAIAGDGR